MGAAYNGDAEEIDVILTMPCDLDAQDSHGVTALMYAAMQGHDEAVQRLIEHGVTLEIQSSQRYTALMYAVRSGNVKAVQNLLRAKADPDVHGNYDTFGTPLIIAAERGYDPAATLVAAGAMSDCMVDVPDAPPSASYAHEGHHDNFEYLCIKKIGRRSN